MPHTLREDAEKEEGEADRNEENENDGAELLGVDETVARFAEKDAKKNGGDGRDSECDRFGRMVPRREVHDVDGDGVGEEYRLQVSFECSPLPFSHVRVNDERWAGRVERTGQNALETSKWNAPVGVFQCGKREFEEGVERVQENHDGECGEDRSVGQDAGGEPPDGDEEQAWNRHS